MAALGNVDTFLTTAAMNDCKAKPEITICLLLHAMHVGGAEVLAARLARQLRDSYRFIVVCLDELGALGKELREEGFPVHVLERRPGLDWRCAWRLARILGREKVRLVNAHQYTPFFYALLARLLHNVPIVFTEHGRHLPDYPRRKRMLANRLLLRRGDRIVSVGQSVRRALITNEGLPPERVSVIYNGVNLGPFLNGTDSRAAVRRELNIGDRDLLILQVARLDYLKDHGTAVRTVEQLAAKRHDVHLVLVGEGPEEGKIQGLIRDHEVAPFVHLLGLRQDVPRLLRAADCFLLTSISEGIPLTVIEAMAAGLPVVATRVGGVGEIVEEGISGFLTPAGDAAALAERLERLASDPGLCRRMGQRGRERALSVFSEEQMHAGYRRLFQETLL